MTGVEMTGMGLVVAAGLGLGALNAPKPPAALNLPMPRHERVFAEREAAPQDMPKDGGVVHDETAERTVDEDGMLMGCGGG